MNDNKAIGINYPDEKLRILVEEFITQQRSTFTLKEVCSYVLYWAMEDGKAGQDGKPIFDGAALKDSDQQRINHILDTIITDGRIAKGSDHYQLVNS